MVESMGLNSAWSSQRPVPAGEDFTPKYAKLQATCKLFAQRAHCAPGLPGRRSDPGSSDCHVSALRRSSAWHRLDHSEREQPGEARERAGKHEDADAYDQGSRDDIYRPVSLAQPGSQPAEASERDEHDDERHRKAAGVREEQQETRANCGRGRGEAEDRPEGRPDGVPKGA